MHPREKVLGLGKLYVSRGEPIPLDVLAEADRLGLSLRDFGQPNTLETDHEGEKPHGNIEEDFYDA